MSGLITKMLIFVFLMVTGYVFARRDPSGGSFTKSASRLVIDVFMSATILNSVLTPGLEVTAGKLGEAMLVVCMSIGSGYLAAALLTALLPVEKSRKGALCLLMAVPNNMFIALPVLQQLYGPEAVFYCGLSNIPFNLLLYTYGVWRLRRGSGEAGFRFRDMWGAPLVCTLLAVLIFLSGVTVPAPLRELASTMAGATMPLSMIVIGASLSSVSLLDAFKNWRFCLSSAVKLLVMPLLAWLLCGLVTADPILLATGTLIAASPSGIIVTVLTIKYGGDAVFTSEAILHSTVLAMLSIPAVVAVLL